jgi:hypothetical protein
MKDQTTEPSVTFVDDDGREYHGAEAMRRGDAWIVGIEAHNRHVLRRMTRTRPAATRTTTRARGAGRPASSKRSSARSGDSGSDDGPSDEPPSRRRLCAFCGRELPPARRKFCTDKHADRYRQRRKRERDRARAVTPRRPTSADFRRMLVLDPVELEQLLRRARAGCRCNGHHLVLKVDAPRCCKCGHERRLA